MQKTAYVLNIYRNPDSFRVRIFLLFLAIFEKNQLTKINKYVTLIIRLSIIELSKGGELFGDTGSFY